MHSITLGLLLPALLVLLSPAPTLAQIPSNKILHTHPTGTAPYYPTGTGSGYYHHPHHPSGIPLSSGGGPSEAGTTCALPTTVTTTTQVTVTVTVPVGGGVVGSPTTTPTAIGTGVVGTGTGIVGPTASVGLVRRRGLEMRGLGEEKMGRKEKRWCFPELGDLPHTCPKGPGNGHNVE